VCRTFLDDSGAPGAPRQAPVLVFAPDAGQTQRPADRFTHIVWGLRPPQVVRYDPRKSPDTVGVLLAIAIAPGLRREKLWPIIDPTTDGLPACSTVDPVREKGPHRGGARSVPLILRQHAPSAGTALPSGGP